MSKTYGSLKAADLYVDDVLIAATPAEINARCDDSAMSETVIAAGAVSVSVAETSLALVGAGAVTLAVPTKPAMIKIITMTVDNGDVTLALTNVVGGSAATTCTFNDANDVLVLVSDLARAKWVVLKEVGVTLA
jgi:hypothetical protein